jgi:response regulator NasT
MERLRVLIADDEVLVAEALREEAQRLGHEVVATAVDGAEAVALAKKLRPDVAILDVKMPEMDGLAAAQAIIQHEPIPVIIVTAFVEDELLERAGEAGVLGYLVKPVDETQLKAALKVAMSRFGELSALRQEVASLKEALEVRKMVERAKGILMDRLQLSENEAFKKLQKRARDTNRKLGDVARAIVEASELL